MPFLPQEQAKRDVEETRATGERNLAAARREAEEALMEVNAELEATQRQAAIADVKVQQLKAELKRTQVGTPAGPQVRAKKRRPQHDSRAAFPRHACCAALRHPFSLFASLPLVH
eukprot:100459-Chlamydomonas_euryale.AAC.1